MFPFSPPNPQKTAPSKCSTITERLSCCGRCARKESKKWSGKRWSEKWWRTPSAGKNKAWSIEACSRLTPNGTSAARILNQWMIPASTITPPSRNNPPKKPLGRFFKKHLLKSHQLRKWTFTCSPSQLLNSVAEIGWLLAASQGVTNFVTNLIQ